MLADAPNRRRSEACTLPDDVRNSAIDGEVTAVSDWLADCSGRVDAKWDDPYGMDGGHTLLMVASTVRTKLCCTALVVTLPRSFSLLTAFET